MVSVTVNEGVVRARGIPYGRADRFEAPSPVELSGEVDGRLPGPVCPQRPSRLNFVTGPVLADLRFDEACLVVSVTAPVDAADAPVMVWFHGGAYVAGGGESPNYDPTPLVRDGGVVVVNVTYRLGIFGYLSPPNAGGDTNLGLRDQILALGWVRDHIAAFGGDPAAVTVFGQSAGADSVLALMLCEDAVGLFHRAVVQSAPLGVGTQNTAVHAERVALATAMRAAMSTSLAGTNPRTVDRGRLLTAEGAAVAAAQDFGSLGGLGFAPLLGHAPLPAPDDVADRLAAAARRVELLIGYTKDDGAPFVAMDRRVNSLGRAKVVERLAVRAATPLITRRVFGVASFVETWRDSGGRAASYRFDWSPPRAPFGACHCMELALLFDSAAWSDAPMLGGDAVDSALAARMRSLWTSFARDGVAALPSQALRFG